MLPLLIGGAVAAAAVGVGAWLYEANRSSGGSPWGGWAVPPAVAGYTLPPCGSQPPSWCWQGPANPGAPSTGSIVNVSITPGTIAIKPAVGSTVLATLPQGATWDANTPTGTAGVPTCIGGDQTGAEAGTSAPLSISGFAGAGTIQLNWNDVTGIPQTTMLDLS